MTADPEVGVDDRAAPWRGEHEQPEPPELHGAVADEPTRRRHSHVGGGDIAFHAGVAAATVVVIRILGDGWSGGFPITFPDSSSYLKVAGIGPLWPSFWFDERPIGFPLFTWMFGRSERFTVFAQTVVYVAAFSALIVAVWRSLQSRLARVVALVFVAAVATQPRFAMWNPLMLSESLSLSLGVASLAGWWSFAAVPGRRRALIAATITVCWLVVRDSNVIIVVGFVVPTVLLTWRFGHGIPASARRVLVPIAACLLAVGGYLFVAQSVTERNVYAVYNNVGMRVLPDEDMTEWWVDHGMPINDTLRGRTGKNSWDDGSAFLTDPELSELRAWAEGPGQRVQALSTFVEFDFWFDRFRDDLPTLLAEPFAAYDNFRVADRLPQSWFGLTGPRSLAALGWWSLIAAFGAVAALTRASMRRLGVLVIVGLGATAIESYIGHAADPMEIGRHLVGPICRFTLLLLLGAVLAIEYLATFRSARAAGATESFGVDGESEPPPSVSAVESGDVATGSAQVDSAAVSRLSMSGRVTEGGRRLWTRASSGRFRSSIAAGGLTVLITTFVLAAVFGNEFRARNVDPLYIARAG